MNVDAIKLGGEIRGMEGGDEGGRGSRGKVTGVSRKRGRQIVKARKNSEERLFTASGKKNAHVRITQIC